MINEQERLNAVSRFIELDAGINNDLNELINLIARICNVPVALISIIDEKMQWFKASVGVGNVSSNDRNLSFCQETILQRDILVVDDATLDERFANLPIVTGPPYIRFYAGAPLLTYDGHAVGSVCVLDVKPVHLDDLQKDALRVFTKQIQNLIELNWSMQSLVQHNASNRVQEKIIEDSDLKLKAIFSSSKDVHLLIGQDMEILAFNKAAYNYIKTVHKKEIAIGMHLLSVANQGFLDEIDHNIQSAFCGSVITEEWQIEVGKPTMHWMEVNFEPVSDNSGNVIGVAINAANITSRKLDAEQIKLQDAALQRIAAIQSHELRRPVASLLGLMDVMKLDENYVLNGYHSMIETTINELDGKIKNIVQESEQVISSNRA